MADLTFQHLDAEEDYIICRGHILIASAAEEAVKTKKTWKCLFKPKHRAIYFEFSSYIYTELKVKGTAFKSAQAGIKFPLAGIKFPR